MPASKRLRELTKLVDKDKTYTPTEGLALAKKTSGVKFDANVELHVRVGIDPKKGDQQVRATLTFAKPVGKEKIIAAFVSAGQEKEAKAAGATIVGGEELIKSIVQSKKTDFDVAVATPDMMKALAPAARVLGPRGLMPSPKNGSVTANIAAAIEEIKKGRMDVKNDAGGNLHIVLGKVSSSDEDLLANFQAAMEAIRKAKPSSSKGTYVQSVTVCSGMGPGVRVQTS